PEILRTVCGVDRALFFLTPKVCFGRKRRGMVDREGEGFAPSASLQRGCERGSESLLHASGRTEASQEKGQRSTARAWPKPPMTATTGTLFSPYGRQPPKHRRPSSQMKKRLQRFTIQEEGVNSGSSGRPATAGPLTRARSPYRSVEQRINTTRLERAAAPPSPPSPPSSPSSATPSRPLTSLISPAPLRRDARKARFMAGAAAVPLSAEAYLAAAAATAKRTAAGDAPTASTKPAATRNLTLKMAPNVTAAPELTARPLVGAKKQPFRPLPQPAQEIVVVGRRTNPAEDGPDTTAPVMRSILSEHWPSTAEEPIGAAPWQRQRQRQRQQHEAEVAERRALVLAM
ncbi:unnamed protein product, partial [Phaeothamnion confervicola]